MKNLILVLSVVGVVLHLRASDIEIPHVTVTGTAVTMAQPDQLRWNIRITAQGGEVAALAKNHAARVAQAIEFLKASGIQPEDLQSDHMEFSEHYEYRNNSQLMDGYEANGTIRFTQKDLTKYRELWIGLSKITGVRVNNTQWDISSRIALQESTRLDAIRAAKKKAKQMAEALDTKVGEPLEIEEQIFGSNPSYNLMGNSVNTSEGSSESADGEQTELAPGTIPIRIRVNVTFRLQKS